MSEYLTIVLGLIMGILSLLKERSTNKRKINKPVQYKLLKWEINKLWYDTIIVTLMIFIAGIAIFNKYHYNIVKKIECNT